MFTFIDLFSYSAYSETAKLECVCQTMQKYDIVNEKIIDNSLIRKTHNELTRQYNYSKFKMAIWG